MKTRRIIQLFLLFPLSLLCSCIQDEASNDEADIETFTFPENSLRTGRVEIYNDYVVAYPLPSVNLRDSAFQVEVTPGATWEYVPHQGDEEILYQISVTSESGNYTKLYSINQIIEFPELYRFDKWVRPSSYYRYENPKEGSMQWYSSNNGAAIAWNSPDKPASEYLVKPYKRRDGTAAELTTMKGPGSIAGGINYIPCLSGSMYLGGFNIMTGLTNPLRSTMFGVPYSNGKPLRLTGEYIFKRGKEDYINSDGTTDAHKDDLCSIYAILFKTDQEVEFLYGDNISTSPNVIARAELDPSELVEGNDFIPFELHFDYDSYPMPFSWAELVNEEYKISIVCASSSRGQHYEGRPGNTLIVDNLRIHYAPIE